MRILLVSPSYARVGCGVGDHVACLAAELAGRGHQVHVATDPPGARPRGPPAGVEAHTVFRRHTLGEVRALAHLARELRPDVVHVHYQVTTYSYRAAILTLPGRLRGHLPGQLGGRFRDTPAIAITVHDFLPPYVFRGAGLLRRALLRRFLRAADAVVVSTAAHRAMALEHGARATTVHDLVMPSNIAVFPRDAERERALDARFGIGGRTLLLVFGAMSLANGGERLLRALGLLPTASRERLRCLLVGGAPAYADDPGGELAAVRELARSLGLAGCAEATGYLEAEEVSRLMRLSRAVVQARDGGISPIHTSASTAILHRRPLLAVGGGEPLDPRMPAAAIHRCAPEPAALAEAIRRLAHGDTLWPPDAAAALDACADRFSWSHVADEHGALYGAIAARPAATAAATQPMADGKLSR